MQQNGAIKFQCKFCAFPLVASDVFSQKKHTRWADNNHLIYLHWNYTSTDITYQIDPQFKTIEPANTMKCIQFEYTLSVFLCVLFVYWVYTKDLTYVFTGLWPSRHVWFLLCSIGMKNSKKTEVHCTRLVEK